MPCPDIFAPYSGQLQRRVPAPATVPAVPLSQPGIRVELPRAIFVTLLMLLLLIITLPCRAPAQEQQYRQVLVLHSYHKGFKWTDDISRGISSILDNDRGNVRIHYEYMDTKRVAGTHYFGLLRETYRLKFSTTRFRVIIAADNDAFEFLRSFRDDLFPGTPVVFCGVNDFDPSQLQGARLFTGVNESADLGTTLNLALRLHPAVRRVVVINDTTTTGRIMHRKLQAVLPSLQRPVRLTFLETVTIPQIREALAGLGADSLVFFTLFFQDGRGRFLEYDEAISLIAPHCPVPIYGVWDFYLGNGIVGGMLTSGFSQGETAARLAARILDGESPRDIPVEMKSPNRPMFDYRQLTRFRISPALLPRGSTFINAPASRYIVSRAVFWGAVASLAGSALIILFLLYNTMRRVRAEERSRRLAAIVDSSRDAIIGTTPDGIITSWNRGAEKSFGRGEGEVIGTHLTRLVTDERQEELREIQERLRRGESVEHFESVHARDDGGETHLSFSFSPVCDAQGRVVAISAVGQDISERRRAERLSLEHALINRELQLAHEIQQSFLLECPRRLPGLLTACRCEPAAKVGGDYYDLFIPCQGVVDCVIADITGHSVGSALLMTETRSVLRAEAATGHRPGRLLAEVNNLLHDDLSRAEMQLSMFYARIDGNGRRLSYANAGHCRPLLYRATDGSVLELDAEGMILGIMRDVVFQEVELLLEAGDVLLLYTDGVIEVETRGGDLFGVRRLTRLLVQWHEHHPEQIIDAILEEVNRFSAGEARRDDIALFAVTITPDD